MLDKLDKLDKSTGYEALAATFAQGRGRAVEGVGTAAVRQWARTLAPGATVLDLGCGTGIPISRVLREAGLTVYGIDASPTLVSLFRANFPDSPVACESVADSAFFQRPFAAVIAWGLLFLLAPALQALVIHKAAAALPPGGKLLFTAPAQRAEWPDVLTGQLSTSLGAAAYQALLAAAGLALVEEFDDEGANHYYHAVKL